jgi:pimeloyl-ACP methyl ester carboxylesterase
LKTPLLWLAAGADTLLPEPAERRSAAYYGADYVVVDGAGHNIMMEETYRETAVLIHDWLAERVTRKAPGIFDPD